MEDFSHNSTPCDFFLAACLVYTIILMNGEKDKGSNLRVDLTPMCLLWRFLVFRALHAETALFVRAFQVAGERARWSQEKSFAEHALQRCV